MSQNADVPVRRAPIPRRAHYKFKYKIYGRIKYGEFVDQRAMLVALEQGLEIADKHTVKIWRVYK